MVDVVGELAWQRRRAGVVGLHVLG
jgi:hypothetical protein